MRSVIEEKGSRIMEVLMSSVSPFQLMMGKVLGLGAATFTTLLIWAALGVLFYFGKGSMVGGDTTAVEQMIFNPAIAVIFILNMVVGYLLYSTLFALVGSIVNSEKEAQGFVMPIVMMLMLPVIVGIAIIQEPNGTLATTISMIPFFAPTMMTMRAIFVIPSLTHISVFSGIIAQAGISLILMALTTVAMIWVTGRIFRIGILMYGKRPTLPEVVKWVKYR
jgi:ABC-2 type transport system permease protein